jgi:transposase
MPQMHLPLFPDGVEHITSELAFERKDGQVTYFNGHMPLFIHAEEDTATFRMITAQFCINGNATQADISRAFGITLISVKRAVKRYRQRGVAGFYEEPQRRGPAVLTEAVLKQAQERFDEGLETSAVAEQLGVKRDTLAKAIRAGRPKTELKGKCAIVTSYAPSIADSKGETTGAGETDALFKYAVYRRMLADWFNEPAETAVNRAERF